MAEYMQLNLSNIIDELGEDRTKSILSNFVCSKNLDVENFLKTKAIEFSKRGFSKTHLIFYVDEETKKFVGYFTIIQKYITVEKGALSNGMLKKINHHGQYDSGLKKYTVSAILIGQLGKNYYENNNELITGDVLLKLAMDKIQEVQNIAGGRFVYIECADEEKLISFYKSNGFFSYGKRKLENDEKDISTTHLVQMLCYL